MIIHFRFRSCDKFYLQNWNFLRWIFIAFLCEIQQFCYWNLSRLQTHSEVWPLGPVETYPAVPFKKGVRPLIMVGKLCAIKNNKPGKLVEFVTRRLQNLRVTSLSRTPGRWHCYVVPRSGEPPFSFSRLLPNGSHPFTWGPGKQEGRSCIPPLDSGTIKSIVKLKALPNLRNKIPFFMRSTEGKDVKILHWEINLNDEISYMSSAS